MDEISPSVGNDAGRTAISPNLYNGRKMNHEAFCLPGAVYCIDDVCLGRKRIGRAGPKA